MITNIHFLNQINHQFFLNFHLINKYIENNKKNGVSSEQLAFFANQCIYKIINILRIHKYFNIITEDSITCLSTFLKYTIDVIDPQHIEKIEIYILPFWKKEKWDIGVLKDLSTDGEKIQTTSIGNMSSMGSIGSMDSMSNMDSISNMDSMSNMGGMKSMGSIGSMSTLKQVYEKNEEEKTTGLLLPKNQNVTCRKQKKEKEKENCVNFREENISCDDDDAFFLFFKDSNEKEKIHIDINNDKNTKNEELFANFNKRKNEIKKICKSIGKTELIILLEQHMLEMEIVKKENDLLKKKLNYIFLNAGNFINSQVHFLMSKKSSLFFKKGVIEIKKEAQYMMDKNNFSKDHGEMTRREEKENNTQNDTKQETEKAKAQEMEWEEMKQNKKSRMKERDVVERKVTERESISIHMNYGQIKMTDDYFTELKKYEKEKCQKINNVLVNMYVYNPYVYVKHKNTEEMTKVKKKKKVLFLPYDTYKNIQTIINKDVVVDKNRLFSRLQTSCYLIFCKICNVFKIKTDN